MIKGAIMASNKIIKAILACSGIYAIYSSASQYTKHHTSLPSIVGSTWLPWAGLAITVVGSIMFTAIFRSTKLGRSLL